MRATPAQGHGGRVAIIVVAAVTALAGVAAAVAMVVTAAEVPNGRATEREVTTALVAAWASGDGDRAVGLMPSFDELTAALDCPQVLEDDARRSHDRQRAEVWAKARMWPQRRPHLHTVAPQAAQAKETDQVLGRCRTRAPFAMQTVDLTLELDGGGHGAYDVSVTLVQLDGRWYLLDAGRIPASLEKSTAWLVAAREARRQRHKSDRRDADDDFDRLDLFSDRKAPVADDEDHSVWAAIGGPSSAEVSKLRTLRAANCACKDLDCLKRTDIDLAVFKENHDATKASDDEHRAIQQELEAFDACTKTVRHAVAPRTGIPACDEYIDAIEAYMRCDSLPATARDGMAQALDAMRQAWTDTGNLPPEARDAMNDGCRSAVDAVKQAADAMGCTSTGANPPPPPP